MATPQIHYDFFRANEASRLYAYTPGPAEAAKAGKWQENEGIKSLRFEDGKNNS